MRAWQALGIAAAFAAALTLVVSLTPAVRFAYYAPELHVALDTAEALIAALAAFLLHGRFRKSGSLDDLALVVALALLAIANLGLSSLPRVFLSGDDARIALWAPLPVRLGGAVAIAAAGVLPARPLRRPQHVERVLALLIVGGVVAVVTALVVVRPQLPPIDLPPLPLETSRRPQSTQLLLTVWVQAATLVCYTVAALRFAARAERRRDELLTWIAAGCGLAAFARINYLLFPSLYTEWVYTGDALRLGFYVLLLAGAAREISAYWRALAARSVRDERRRIARNLHDGLAQELAFISSQSRRLTSSDATAGWISAAAERALDESRRAIRLLTDTDEPLDTAVATTADVLGRRMGVTVQTHVESDVAVTAEVREELLRIVREAVTNAARHGRPQSIRVRLRRRDGLVLTVEDDGTGFDPSSAPARFGLQTMRERAGAVGGELEIASQPGRGTVVEVRIRP